MIREATRDIHERLHDHTSFGALLARTITREEYRALLEALYGFHQPLETALVAHADGQAHLRMIERRRAHLLIDDLSALGRSRIADLPMALPPARLGEPSRFLGSL